MINEAMSQCNLNRWCDHIEMNEYGAYIKPTYSCKKYHEGLKYEKDGKILTRQKCELVIYIKEGGGSDDK